MSGDQTPPQGVGDRAAEGTAPVPALPGFVSSERDFSSELPSPAASPRQKQKPPTIPWETLPEAGLWNYYMRLKSSEQHPRIAARMEEVRRRLFDMYREDVLRVVGNYNYYFMPQYSLVEQADLEQAALLAMWRTLPKYDPKYGTKFMEFFNARNHSRLRGAIIDALRSLQEYPREIARLRRVIKPLIAKLRNKLYHTPSPEEFCDEYGWQYAAVFQDRLYWSGVFNQQLSSPRTKYDSGGDEEEKAIEPQVKQEDTSAFSNRDIWEYILSLIKDQDINYIIWAYYHENDTNERIAKTLQKAGRKSCSLSWVVNKHNEGKRLLRELLPPELARQFLEGND